MWSTPSSASARASCGLAKIHESETSIPPTIHQARSLPSLPERSCPFIHNVDAGLLTNPVHQMLHAALLLLMLEAVHTALVSPLAAIHKPLPITHLMTLCGQLIEGGHLIRLGNATSGHRGVEAPKSGYDPQRSSASV